jgi:hypothetical protein
VPTLVVDTSVGYADDLTAVLRFIRSADATTARGAPTANTTTTGEERP